MTRVCCVTNLCDASCYCTRHLSFVSERVTPPRPWPCLTEFGGPETTSGRGTLMTLVVAAVCPDDPSLQLPLDYQVSEVRR